MEVPENVLNPVLYRRARKIADETYKRNSAYKSMFIQKKYQDLGGKYKGKKNMKGVTKWNSEKWVQVVPFLEEDKRIPCGFGSNSKGCRPTVRVDSNTPSTIQQLIKKHSKTKLLKFAKDKKRDMNKRLNWEKLEFF